MNKFEFNQSVKKSSLSSSEKLILLEILSFIENDKAFYATNKHLASIFNFSESYVKKIISKFQNLGIIESKVDKKKHQSGDQTWYNKRYITINFNTLSSFLQIGGSIESPKPIISDLNHQITLVESSVVDNEIIPEIEDNEADEFDYDDEAQSLWFNTILNENSMQVSNEVVVVEEVVVEQLNQSIQVKTDYEQSSEIIEQSDSASSEKKEKFRKEFESAFKYNAGSMNATDFHQLTKNHFLKSDFKSIFNCYFGIRINDYDEFWDNLQKLKNQ